MTWFFCEFPRHKDNIRWHPFNCKHCRAWKAWKDQQQDQPPPASATPPPPAANIGDADDSTTTTTTTTQSSESVNAALAHALSLASGNDSAYRVIADALASLENL